MRFHDSHQLYAVLRTGVITSAHVDLVRRRYHACEGSERSSMPPLS